MAKPAVLAAVERRWLTLPANTRGALWVLVAAFAASLMFLAAKILDGRIHLAQITFFRAVVGLLIVGPMLFGARRQRLKKARPLAHVCAGLCGVSALFCNFYAVTHLNFADAVAFAFARSLFVVVLAVFFLHEIVRMRRWSATLVGFVGVLVMLRPDGEIAPAALVALLGALFAGASMTLIKSLSASEDATTVLFYFVVASAAVSVIPGLVTWPTPTADELVLLVVVSLAGWANLFCFTRGFRIGDASALIPVDYSRLLFAALFGFVLFAEVPGPRMWVGAAIIIVANLYIARREAQFGDTERAPHAV